MKQALDGLRRRFVMLCGPRMGRNFFSPIRAASQQYHEKWVEFPGVTGAPERAQKVFKDRERSGIHLALGALAVPGCFRVLGGARRPT